MITIKFYETSDRILELTNDAESLWKTRSDVKKVEFLKLVISNQTLNTACETVDDVTIEYTLKTPFKELAKIKKALWVKQGFLENSKKWCPLAGSNHGHRDFQSLALPTELRGHK